MWIFSVHNCTHCAQAINKSAAIIVFKGAQFVSDQAMLRFLVYQMVHTFTVTHGIAASINLDRNNFSRIMLSSYGMCLVQYQPHHLRWNLLW